MNTTGFESIGKNVGNSFSKFFDLFVERETPTLSRGLGQGAFRGYIPCGGKRDCVLIIDKSGSMLDKDWRPSRMEAAFAAAGEFCRRLGLEQPGARVALVGFGDRAKVLAAMTPAEMVDPRAPEKWDRACLGGTRIDKGLALAIKLLNDSDGIGQVVLLTDGQDQASATRRVAAELTQRAVLDCVGIGGSPADVDEGLLKSIATKKPDGTPRYRWIGDPEELNQHFRDLAGGLSRS